MDFVRLYRLKRMKNDMFADMRPREVRAFENIANLFRSKWLLSINGEVITDQNTGSYPSRSKISWSLLCHAVLIRSFSRGVRAMSEHEAEDCRAEEQLNVTLKHRRANEWGKQWEHSQYFSFAPHHLNTWNRPGHATTKAPVT